MNVPNYFWDTTMIKTKAYQKIEPVESNARIN